MQPDLKLELTQREIDYLKQVHVAQALKELMQHPGWEIYQSLVADLIGNFENQHLSFADSPDSLPARDAYWVSGVRLGGARQMAKILTEEIARRVGILDQPLRPPKPPDPADFDGEPNRNGHQPEGDA